MQDYGQMIVTSNDDPLYDEQCNYFFYPAFPFIPMQVLDQPSPQSIKKSVKPVKLEKLQNIDIL